MAKIEHLLYKERKGWIVKSVCGKYSLQIRHMRKPNQATLESDYALLDGKIELALQVAEKGVKETLEQLGFSAILLPSMRMRKPK
jgi:hypothetical protein